VPLRESFLLQILGTMLLPFGSLLLVTVVTADCSADNCLQALNSNHVQGGIEAVRAFCGKFTTNNQPAAAIPSYAVVACKSNQNGPLFFRISSACGCMAAATSSMAAASTSQTLSATTRTSTVTPPSIIAACAIVSSSWAAQFATAPGGLCIHNLTYFLLTFLSNTFGRCAGGS
jgi:hypothetical protein